MVGHTRLADRNCDAVVTAVSEACTNAVLHAYPDEGEGDFEVTARVDTVGMRRYVRVWVRDWGRWQPQRSTTASATLDWS